MNIDHVSKTDLPNEPVFVAIFKRQHALETKYSPIEQRNGFYYPPDPRPHIDDPQLQTWIKNMFWRTHEEVSEALETIPDLEGKWRERWDTDSDLRHFFEELADALHFLTAVSLTMQVSAEQVQKKWEDVESRFNQGSMGPDDNFLIDDEEVIEMCGRFSFALGLAANTLKNKAWKTTQMTTDQARFTELLYRAWEEFHKVWVQLNCKLEDVWQLYHRKNVVNQFRQETKY